MLTLDEIRRLKREMGYNNEMLAKKSGVPLGTVQKVMAGTTKAPRHSTLEALSSVFENRRLTAENPPSAYGTARIPLPFCGEVRESQAAYGTAGTYTTADLEVLPDDVRAELIDGQIYYMGSPTRTHQKIISEIHVALVNHIRAHHGRCEVYEGPYGVFLDADDRTLVEPDLTVICDPDKSEEKGCVGAPDWVVEVLSPASKNKDSILKLRKYRDAGVREYWIIHPDKRIVMVHLFAGKAAPQDQDACSREEDVTIYAFEDEIPGAVITGFVIRLADYL